MFDMFDEENASKMEENYSSSSNSSSSNYYSGNYYNSNAKGFVLSVGGSVFFSDKPLSDKIIDFSNSINELSNEFNFVIVVGGGKTARNFIEAGKELGVGNFDLDGLGISATKLNAKLFSLKIKKAEFVETIEEAKETIERGRIPVMGGLLEGTTTDGVSALMAEAMNYEFVNLSDVDGIYDSDPKENEEAILFRELSFNDMNFLLRGKQFSPGQNLFVDIQAASILTRSKIKSCFLNGNHLENFRNCLRGNDFKGTIIQDIEDVIEKEDSGERELEKIKEEELDKPSGKKSMHDDFIENNYEDEDSEEDEEIDPRKIDFGK
jgi:uridylate kinase